MLEREEKMGVFNLRGNILRMFMIVFLIVSTIAVVSVSKASPGPTVISVEPPTSTAKVGETFTVNITITDVTNLYFWEFHMNFSSTILNAIGVTEGPFLSDVDSTSWSMAPPNINNTAGTVKAFNNLWTWPPGGANGTGVLCNITFQVKEVGNTALDFYYTLLDDEMGHPVIEHTAEDGFFSNVHDVAITEVTASPNSVAVGEPVSIDVTVANEGDFPETFDVTTYWNIGALHGVIGTNVTSLDGGTSTLLQLTWSTEGICTGIYTISAEASVVLDESYTADNTLIDGEVTVNATGQPEAKFTYSPTNPKVGENITFTSTSTDPNGTIVSWDWTFDDGSIGSGEVVTHAYAETGIYNVTLNVADNEGLCNIVWKPVKVSDYPVASFNYSPEEPLRNRTVTFDASGSTPDGGTIDSYAWDFGDGTTETYVGANLTAIAYHAYEQEGTYTVNLTVTNSEMLTDSFTDTLDVKIKHDVSVTSISYDYPGKPSIKVYVGYTTITVDIVARNEGTETETFNVTTYYDDHIIETPLVTNLTSGASQELNVIWNPVEVPAGEYIITAEAILVGDENSTNNNKTITIDFNIADLAITDVIVSSTTVLAGDLLNVSVTIRNEGTVTPTIPPTIRIYFTNATYSNVKIMEIPGVEIGEIPNGTEKTGWKTWDITDVNQAYVYVDTVKVRISPGTYTLSAEVSPVQVGANIVESDLADNSYIYGDVTVGASSISISANPANTKVGSRTTINGSITPKRPGVNVTIQYRLSGNETWNTLETVTTNENSTYSYNWKPETVGTYEVKASWQGDNDTLPGESETLTITVNQAQPNVFLYVLAAVAIIAMAAIAIYLLKFRKPKPM